MKVKDFNLLHWQDWQFTTARHYGGMTYNGEKYTYFEPVIPGEPNNPDGSPYVAWLMVRSDFLKFARQEAKKMGSTHSMKDDVTQGELLV